MAREEPSSYRNIRGSEKKRTLSFELTLLQSCLLAVIFFFSFVWVFYVGVTVGKHFPEDKGKLSLLQKIALAMGYNPGKKVSAETKKEQEASPSPGEMQLELAYHKELSKPVAESTSRITPIVHSSTTLQTTKTPRKTTSLQPPKESSSSYVAVTPSPVLDDKERSKLDVVDTPPTTTIESTGEKYTVLVASFKSAENAGKLEQTLKAKGYMVSRHETVVKNETWYRVTVGNFDSRESAVRFMAMFNEKEGLKGVVIRK
ncbi:MAG: SPOR domain-containing protein [Thermodesulforhabdaceae bacterium]